MKRFWITAVVMTLASALAMSWAIAQDAGEPERGRPAGDRRPRAGQPGRAPGQGGQGQGRRPMMGGRRPGVPGQDGMAIPPIPNLTQEQRKRIAKAREDAVKEVRKIRERMYESIRKLLDPDQVRVFDEGRRRMTHRGPDGVTLTDEQKAAFDKAREDAAKIDDPQARGAFMRKAVENIRKTFTPEQQKQAEEFRRRFGGQGEGPRRGGPDRGGGPDRRGGLDEDRRPRRPDSE